MATTYNAKLSVNCLKQHVCLGCEAEYQYKLERNVTGSGGSQEAAAANAEKAAIKALENDVDQHACPHCGMLQPDMVAASRSSRFSAGMWLGPVIILVGFFLALPHVITISTSAMVAAGGAVLSLLLLASGVFHNPNKDMSAGQAASSAKVQSGVIVLTKEGNTSTSVDDFGPPGGGHWTGLGLTGMALVAALAPLVLPVISGWTLNEGAYPAVAGPGDETCVYFDQEIRALKAMWRGSASVRVTNPDELGNAQFSGKTKSSTWGNTISGKSVSNESRTMYVELTVPDSADIAGKTARLDMEVNAVFPFEQAGGFIDKQQQFRHSTELQLSGPGSGATYWQAWIFGQIGAVVLIIAAGISLHATASSLVKTANPPNILVEGSDEDDDYDEEDDEGEEY